MDTQYATEARQTATEAVKGEISLTMQLQNLHCSLIDTRHEMRRMSYQLNGGGPECDETKPIPPSTVAEYMRAIDREMSEIRHLSAKLSNAIGG